MNNIKNIIVHKNENLKTKFLELFLAKIPSVKKNKNQKILSGNICVCKSIIANVADKLKPKKLTLLSKIINTAIAKNNAYRNQSSPSGLIPKKILKKSSKS